MEELKNVINEITSKNNEFIFSNTEEKLKYYVTKYPKISNAYPTLIKKACESNFDVDKFMWMLDIATSVKEDDISQHDASVKVGERLVDEYVKPLI